MTHRDGVPGTSPPPHLTGTGRYWLPGWLAPETHPRTRARLGTGCAQ